LALKEKFPEKALLKPKEIISQGVLPIKRTTIYKQMAAGKIQTTRIGRSVFVSLEAIADFLAACTSSTNVKDSKEAANKRAKAIADQWT
jgi:hypothetical protein